MLNIRISDVIMTTKRLTRERTQIYEEMQAIMDPNELEAISQDNQGREQHQLNSQSKKQKQKLERRKFQRKETS